MKTPLSTCAIVAALITSASATVTMDWVTIGDINNAADPLTGYGSVDHAYRIGKYEVTNAQYGEFLNAKGQSNSNSIYNASMPTYGITQSGTSGSFSYTVTTALAQRPVVYVSWFDAARFANWMMNGQGGGDMETGAYTLNGATSGIITANIGAQVYLPSENEWYKAAYYNAANTSYSLYPNGKNTITTADANYGSGGPTAVGSYADNPSYYGTYDQGGNAFEWIDKVVSTDSRMTRGSAWDWYGAPSLMSSQGSTFAQADLDFSGIGFRLAAVPEPTSMVLTALASGMMLIRRKR
jgi:formylglycine-generating enzyme required for sulfatase activity